MKSIFWGSTAYVLSGACLLAASFINPENTHMFAVPYIKGDLETFDWKQLPTLDFDRGTIFRGVEGKSAFNLHSYLIRHGGKYWAMWSCGLVGEDLAGQYIRYATSPDGLAWSESRIMVPPDGTGTMRFIARGFWEREGQLLALVSRDEAYTLRNGVKEKGKYFGDSLELRYYVWDEAAGEWNYGGAAADNTINNFPPKKLPGGEWMMSRRDKDMNKSLIIGGVRAIDDWEIVSIAEPEDGHRLEEPYWWVMEDGVLAALFRDNSRSHRLYRAFSTDNGRSWTQPVRTDFPDARSKFNAVKTSSGHHVLVSNPNPSGRRIPLCLSVSRDGRVFERMALLLGEETQPRHEGGSKTPGYQYPQVSEYEGYLFVIYALNKEDIEILRIPLGEIEKLSL